MPMKLIRRPRSPQRQIKEIRDEVKVAYDVLADNIIDTLNIVVQNWQHKPKFTKKVSVEKNKWQVEIKWDRRTKEGKIFGWVDEGTAERGGKGQPYDIYPKNKKALAFDVPYYPKTTPGIVGAGPGVVLESGSQQQEHVVTTHVVHPGIQPRFITESIRTVYGSRTLPGAFRSVTEAAIKRGLRKVGKQR